METLFGAGLSNAACAAGLAVLAWLISQVFRRPALSHALWVLVLLKLVTPPIWNVPISIPAVSIPPAQAARVENDSVLSVSTPTESKDLSFDYRAPAPSQAHTAWVPHAFRALWLAGTVACALVAALRLRRFRGILIHCVLASPDVQREAHRIGALLGLRIVPVVYLLPGPISPMLWAAFGRSRILLPSELWDRLTGTQQSSLLAHELAHFRRGDHWIRILELIVTSLYWWNPVLWWARHELHIAEETCCDAWVAWALPDSAPDYASALIETIDFASLHRSMPVPASGIGKLGTLKRRLLMIQQGNNTRRLGIVGTLMVCSVALLLPLRPGRAQSASQAAGIGNSKPKAADSRPTSRESKESANGTGVGLWNRRLSDVSFEDVPWTTAIARLHEMSGIRFEIDRQTLEAVGIRDQTPVTIKLHNVAPGTVLQQIMQAAAPKRTMMMKVTDGAVRITVASKPLGVQSLLDRTLPTVQFDGVNFGDVVDFLRDVSGANLMVDWKAIEPAGIFPNTPVTTHLKNISFGRALTEILNAAGGGQAKLGYRIDQDVITISTTAALSKQYIVQIYNVRDLTWNGIKPNQLIETIIDSVDPQSWKLRGGSGGDIREDSGDLTVTQTPANQHAIAELLVNLRQLTKSARTK